MSHLSMSPAYAYIIAVAVKPSAADTVAAMFREGTAPLIGTAPGVLSLVGLLHRPSGRAMSIRVWQTAADRALSDISNQAVVDDLARYAPYLTGTYTRDPYDVTVHILPLGDPERSAGSAVARVRIEAIRPDRWDEGVGRLRAFATRNQDRWSPGYGTILFENRSIGRAVLLELAESRRELDARVADPHLDSDLPRDLGSLGKRVDQQVFDVIARC